MNQHYNICREEILSPGRNIFLIHLLPGLLGIFQLPWQLLNLFLSEGWAIGSVRQLTTQVVFVLFQECQRLLGCWQLQWRKKKRKMVHKIIGTGRWFTKLLQNQQLFDAKSWPALAHWVTQLHRICKTLKQLKKKSLKQTRQLHLRKTVKDLHLHLWEGILTKKC